MSRYTSELLKMAGTTAVQTSALTVGFFGTMALGAGIGKGIQKAAKAWNEWRAKKPEAASAAQPA
jgi:hypothetical protein